MESFPKPEIRGKDLSPKQENEARMQLVTESKERLLELLAKYPERAKTPEELESIDVTLDILHKEVVRLCGENSFKVAPENIHILEQSAAEEMEGESLLAGRAFPASGEAVIADIENVGALEKLHTIVHESTHLYSSSIATMRPDTNNELEQIRDKAGYVSTARITPTRVTRNNFEGLDEAVVEKVSLSVITELFHRQEELFGEERYDVSDFTRFMGNFHRISAYADAIQIIESIVRRVARESERDEGEVWDDLKRGTFTGSVMHLRQIEKVYGPGSLRYLAEMPLGAYEYEGNQEAYEREIEQMKEFFS